MTDPGIGQALQGIRDAGRYRRLRSIGSATGPRVRLDGRDVLLMCSNDYLGLANDPRVVAAAQRAASEWGTGSGASRLVSGNLEVHERLEGELATLKGQEACLLFPSGYQANVGAIPALAGAGDLVLSDRLNHASLIDACRLSGATVRVYDHADPDSATGILRAERRRHNRAVVATDGVFSMDGDLAPLPALAEACERYDAKLWVDDAHGTGVLGDGGAGTARHLGVPAVDYQMGTLSKALGSQGGFVCAGLEEADLLRNTSRGFIFSTALAPPLVGAATAAMQVLRTEPERRARLLRNARLLRDGLQGLGLRVPEGPAAIVPVLVGREAPAMRLMEELERRGVFAAAIRPPTVPAGSCRVRVTVMATHTEADIEAAVHAFGAAARAAGVL